MLLSPSRPALINRTNVHEGDEDIELVDAFNDTPNSDRKRQLTEPGQGTECRKRAKVDVRVETDSEDDEPVVYVPRPWSRSFAATRPLVAGLAARPQIPPIATRSQLRSFVSSHRSDVFKTHSAEVDTLINLPYACAYSNGAKRGEEPLLAVTTEQGIVHIFNTRRRKDWDCEPQRTEFQPYPNGIFDVQWSADDQLLATASANSSVQISCLRPSGGETLRHLRGHTGSVKCVIWDKRRHGDILYSGGRDGSICVWDLRVGENVSVDNEDGNAMLGTPVLMIPNAHTDSTKPSTPRRKGKFGPPAPLRSVTSLLYSEGHPFGLVSSGSNDGILSHWDLRLPSESTPKRKAKPKIQPTFSSPFDPTTYQGKRRARGITNLAAGTGPTAGQLFALSNDSRIHTYQLSNLDPLSGHTNEVEKDRWSYSHPNMRTNSFYVRIAPSPCGRWIASGGANNGSVYLFDVTGDTRSRWSQHPDDMIRERGVELQGQSGEVGAVDWAEGMLASCADDGTVRVWRPDLEVYRECQRDPERMKWDYCWAWGEARV